MHETVAMSDVNECINIAVSNVGMSNAGVSGKTSAKVSQLFGVNDRLNVDVSRPDVTSHNNLVNMPVHSVSSCLMMIRKQVTHHNKETKR